jgi:hypothetical protein
MTEAANPTETPAAAIQSPWRNVKPSLLIGEVEPRGSAALRNADTDRMVAEVLPRERSVDDDHRRRPLGICFRESPASDESQTHRGKIVRADDSLCRLHVDLDVRRLRGWHRECRKPARYRSASGQGNGLSGTPYATLNSIVVAPMPMASVAIATPVYPGWLRSSRIA